MCKCWALLLGEKWGQVPTSSGYDIFTNPSIHAFVLRVFLFEDIWQEQSSSDPRFLREASQTFLHLGTTPQSAALHVGCFKQWNYQCTAQNATQMTLVTVWALRQGGGSMHSGQCKFGATLCVPMHDRESTMSIDLGGLQTHFDK